MTYLVRVWDLPTRIFHWSVAVCFASLVLTAQLGLMEWHFRLGYAMLTMLLFRFFWGLVGGYWSRFSSFIYSPSSLLLYLRGNTSPELSVGHTPLGALSVFALLLLLLAQVATGLISDDEIASTGPLAHLLSSHWVSLATWYHHQIGQFLLLALVTLHVSAVFFYLWFKRQNLIRPMLLGDKLLDQPAIAAHDHARTRLRALLWLTFSSALVVLLLWLASGP